MIKWIKIKYLKWKYRNPQQYVVEDKVFILDKIPLSMFSKLVKFMESVITEESKDAGGPLAVMADIILRFEDLAKIVFAGQSGVDSIKWNDIDSALAWQIATDVVKKKPELMMHAQSMLNTLGLKLKPLTGALKKIMHTK